MIVLDSSVILASAFDEPGQLDLGDIISDAVISAVNFAEVVAKLQERGLEKDSFDFLVEQCRDICVPLRASQAIQAGLWRVPTRHLGLSLGDRCCLALGLDLGAEVYTAERAWARVDLGVKVRVIR